MFRYLFGLSIIVLTIFLNLSLATALEKSVQQFVDWETKSNAASLRSNKPFELKHYEIPLSLLETDLSKSLSPDVYNALVFKKNGKDYVRWLINPEDTKWHLQLEDWLKTKGVSPKQQNYLKGYYTSSRSMIVEDPKSGAQFSAKVSTNNTGGIWRDKKQDAKDARQTRMADEYLQNIQNSRPPKNFVYLNEPGMFAVDSVDQAMLVRSLRDLNNDQHYYLPGFSALHDQTGRQLALMNGSTNPAEFWNEHYNKPLGRAMAELSAKTGMTYDSPHSQNFLIELDGKMKPTGKIVFRDLGDSYISKPFFEATGQKDFIKKWEPYNINSDILDVRVGVLYGNEFPSWIDNRTYFQWGEDFFKEFDKTFSQITGIPLKELDDTFMTTSGRLFLKQYNTNSPAFQDFYKIAICFQGAKQTLEGVPCPEALSQHMYKVMNRKAPKISKGSCLKNILSNAIK